MTAGIILAAGRSSRMGSDKLLIDLGGEPLIRRSVGTALGAHLDPVVVVTRSDAASIRDVLHGMEVLHCVADTGSQHGSLAAGLDAMPPAVSGAIVLLADMPLVTTAMLQQVRNAWAPTVDLVASRYGTVLAPPVLLPPDTFSAAALATERSVVGELVSQVASVTYVDFPAEWLVDMDTPDDVERARVLAARMAD